MAGGSTVMVIIMIFIPTVIIQNQFLATVILTKSLGKRLWSEIILKGKIRGNTPLFVYHLKLLIMKKDKIVVFPIVITPTDDPKIKYTVNVPDLDRDTQGRTIAEAIDMGKDLIGTMSLVEDLPESNAKIPKTKNNEIATLVTVNISEYKRKNDNRVVKKTLTIPNYLNEEGKEAGLNFSAILADGIKAKLGIE